MNGISEIWAILSDKAEAHFGSAQTHPRYAILIAAALLGLWLAALLLKWNWALHWNFNGRLWFFDNCTPATRRLIQIILVSTALIGCILLFFIYD